MSTPFNGLGEALALSGVTARLDAAARKGGAWQSRRPTARERYFGRLWDASISRGHAISKGASLRKIKLKPKRSF